MKAAKTTDTAFDPGQAGRVFEDFSSVLSARLEEPVPSAVSDTVDGLIEAVA